MSKDTTTLTPKDIEVLAKPFDEKTLGVKVQALSKDKTKAMLVPYLQHTDVATRLDQVDPAWESEITEVKNVGTEAAPWYTVRTRITLKGVSRENVGEGDTVKAAASDGLKRTAMLFGIGRYLYDADRVWVAYDERTDYWKTFTYADYKRGLRTGQEGVAVAPSGQSPVAAPSPVQPAERAYGAGAPAPATSKSLSRLELGSLILKEAKTAKISDVERAEIINQRYGKGEKSLSIQELEDFLAFIRSDLVRA